MDGDFGWNYLTYFLSLIGGTQLYFLVITFLTCFFYFYSSYRFSKLFGFNFYVLVYFVCISPFLFGNLTNVIRSGLALSLVFYSLTLSGNKRLLVYVLCFSIHSSVLLPLVAFEVSRVFSGKYFAFILLWVFILLLSVLGLNQAISNALSPYLGEKFSSYLNLDATLFGGNWGFRWDFVALSIMLIALSSYSLNFRYSKILAKLLITFLISNSFWLLVITIPFSDRFFQLSMFLYGIIFYISIENLKGNPLYRSLSTFSLLCLNALFIFLYIR